VDQAKWTRRAKTVEGLEVKVVSPIELIEEIERW
jgi:hypothetical protein